MRDLSFFQDREPAIAAFDDLWKPGAPWVLAFMGFSGLGKTTLLDWLEINRCAQQLPYAYLSLADKGAQMAEALHAITEAASLASYFTAETTQHYQARRLAALEDQAKRALHLTQSQHMDNAPGGQQAMSVEAAKLRRELEQQTNRVLAEYWLAHITPLARQPKCVFLLDDYDQFQETATREDLAFFWAQLERAQTRVPGLRVVLACREGVRHTDAIAPLMNGLIGNDLAPLSPTDSDRLLTTLGVTDAAFRQAVYTRLAQGHPLITQMAAEAWRETPGGIPALQVPALTQREQAVEWVQGKILERLRAPLKQAVRWAALLKTFNAESLNQLTQSTLTPDDFRILTRYAFVRARPTGWTCHDLVRRVQSAYLQRERPQEFLAFHQRCVQYYLEHSANLTALYHHFFVEKQDAFTAWQALEQEANFNYRHDVWAELMEIGLAPELALPPAMHAEITFKAGRRHYYRVEMDDAQIYFLQALTLFRDIGDRLGEANVLQAIGDVQQFRDDRDAALASYQQALTLFRDIGAKLGEANVLASRGRLLLFSGQGEIGLQELQEALNIFQSIGSVTSQANIYFFLGQQLASNGHLKESLPMLEKAVALGASVAPGHPVTEHMQNVLKAVQQLTTTNNQ